MMNAWLTADASLFLRSVAFNLSFPITVLIDYVFWGTEEYRFQKNDFFLGVERWMGWMCGLFIDDKL